MAGKNDKRVSRKSAPSKPLSRSAMKKAKAGFSVVAVGVSPIGKQAAPTDPCAPGDPCFRT